MDKKEIPKRPKNTIPPESGEDNKKCSPEQRYSWLRWDHLDYRVLNRSFIYWNYWNKR